MREGVTAELFDAQTVESLVAGIERARSRRWDEPAVRENATRFSADHFRSGIEREVVRLCAPLDDPDAVVEGGTAMAMMAQGTDDGGGDGD
jgi:hypothetical protein